MILNWIVCNNNNIIKIDINNMVKGYLDDYELLLEES